MRVCSFSFSLLLSLLMRDKEIWQQQVKLLPNPRLFYAISQALLPNLFDLWQECELCRGYARNNKFKGMWKSRWFVLLLVLIEGLSARNRTQQQTSMNSTHTSIHPYTHTHIHRATEIFTYFHACHFCFSFCQFAGFARTYCEYMGILCCYSDQMEKQMLLLFFKGIQFFKWIFYSVEFDKLFKI